jgi:hypothetical protein
MPQFLKIHNGALTLTRRVYTQAYYIRASDFDDGGTPPDGWTLVGDDVTIEDYAQAWQQPAGADLAYPLGAFVLHGGSVWRSLCDGNVWEPGVSGWRVAGEATPQWVQPTGAHDTYPLGFIVFHGGKAWRSLLDANVWEPGVANWRETFLLPPGAEPQIPDWVQPTGAADAYSINDLVRHNGKVWRSTIDANVWEPGVFGWVEA